MSWDKKTLGELCKIEKGKTGIKKAIPGNYPLVVTSEERKSHNQFQFDDEAVIIPLVSSTGHGHKSLKRIHYQTGKFAVGSILCTIIPKDNSILNAEYLYRYLYLYKEQELVSRMKGMANVTLPIKEILKIKIPIPPINEQRLFVDEFKHIKKIGGNFSTELTQQLDLVKQLKQAFLREAMQGKLTSKWRIRHPELVSGSQSANTLLSKIKAEKEQLIKEKKIKKQKPLPPIAIKDIPFEIPENWKWCRLGEITMYGSRLKAEPSDLNENTWVLDLEDIEKITSNLLCKVRFKERNSLSTKSVFKKGDVLYSKLRPYLDKVIVADENGVCTTEILPLKCYAKMNPYFFRYTLKRTDFLISVNNVTKGMKMPRLGTKEGELALIPLPPLSEQKQIVERLDQLMQYCDQLEESIKASQQQNELLLQQVLREALSPKQKEAEFPIIDFKARICSRPEKAIIAGYIINKNLSDDFGRVKLQKLLYLVEHICKLDFQSNYIKKAAGPYDGYLLRDIEEHLKRYRYFDIWQKKRGDKRVYYKTLAYASELNDHFGNNFENESEKIEIFLKIFKELSWEFCEIVATLYAVWNNRIIKKQTITNHKLKEDFLVWDNQKHKYTDELDKALIWMKSNHIIPDGWGKYI